MDPRAAASAYKQDAFENAPPLRRREAAETAWRGVVVVRSRVHHGVRNVKVRRVGVLGGIRPEPEVEHAHAR